VLNNSNSKGLLVEKRFQFYYMKNSSHPVSLTYNHPVSPTVSHTHTRTLALALRSLVHPLFPLLFLSPSFSISRVAFPPGWQRGLGCSVLRPPLERTFLEHILVQLARVRVVGWADLYVVQQVSFVGQATVLALLAPKGLLDLGIASQGGFFLGWQVPLASRVVSVPSSGISCSSWVHSLQPSLNGQLGPHTPSIGFSRIGWHSDVPTLDRGPLQRCLEPMLMHCHAFLWRCKAPVGFAARCE